MIPRACGVERLAEPANLKLDACAFTSHQGCKQKWGKGNLDKPCALCGFLPNYPQGFCGNIVPFRHAAHRDFVASLRLFATPPTRILWQYCAFLPSYPQGFCANLALFCHTTHRDFEAILRFFATSTTWILRQYCVFLLHYPQGFCGNLAFFCYTTTGKYFAAFGVTKGKFALRAEKYGYPGSNWRPSAC